MPELQKNDCEVRIWQKCQLCFGDAHVLYQVTKTGEEISFFKYVMYFNRYNFIKATKTKLRSTSTNELWQRLVKQGILTLPDESVIADELHTRQQRDSTWSTVDADGTVSVHARKIKPSVWISDGESYHFEIFSTDSYRAYNYGNPDGYVKRRPDIAELRKVVSILDELKGAL